MLNVTAFEIFSREIQENCEFVLFARDDMERVKREEEAALSRYLAGSQQGLMPHHPHMQQWSVERRVAFNRQWYSALNFLVAVGNVSKIFFPSRKSEEVRGVQVDTRERARTLKAAYEVDHDKSLLRKTKGVNTIRDLRDRFEHFDVLVDAWAANPSPGLFIDRNIGSMPDRPYVLRAIDPTAFALRCGDNEQPLQPVIEEIERLLRLATADDGERIYWRFKDDRLVFGLTGAWLERDMYDQRRQWLNSTKVPNPASLTLQQYRGTFVAMLDAQKDTCSQCSQPLVQRDGGYWCDTCHIWRPETLAPSF